VIEFPGTAVPTDGVREDPPSLSVLVMVRVAWAPKASESVAVTVAASEALAVAVLARVPVADELIAAAAV
jgi:hypothetical protein